MNSSQILHNNSKTQGEAYLNFYLNPLTSVILSVKHTQEAIVVPGEIITPMPNMPAFIMGLMSWRSRIIWAVDLPMILNLESTHYRSRQFNIIVIKVESMLLGLVVHNVKGTIKFMPDDIRSPIGQVATSLVPYLRGCVVQGQETLLVLDAPAIVQSSLLQID
ncbi:chemotaxis protein CheW [Calothrix rhizosoleniae]|uniref:chemotaxis protein CheW n=1 Tax=Calothrix rhizosoleniae TaxID=888997 RepID=UPI000B49D4B7|nr:chemotaxis protein CheW [Calothrix rhizosoleniae]